jgi:hypothetical protein
MKPPTLRINCYSLRTWRVPGSVARLSGAADTTRGARRTVDKRNAVEKSILGECLPELLGSALLGVCVLNEE